MAIKAALSLFEDPRHVDDQVRTIHFFARSILPESLAEQAVIVEQAFLQAVEQKEDEVAADLLGELETARRKAAEKLEWQDPERRDWHWNLTLRLMNLFWDMPAYPESPAGIYGEEYDRYESGRREDERRRKGLLQTKLRMLALVGQDWHAKPEDRHVLLYRFFLSVHHAKQHRQMEWETKEEHERRWNRTWRGEERKALEEIFKTSTDRFEPAQLDRMISDPDLPADLAYHAVTARARKGGVDLARRDVRNGKLLAEFEPDKRSPEATRLALQVLGEIAARDREAAEIVATMQPKRGYWKSEEIGKSDYVRGEIRIQMEDPDRLVIVVAAPEGDSEALVKDGYERAVRHADNSARRIWRGRFGKLVVNQGGRHIGSYSWGE